MKILVAPDKFKGSMSATEAAEAMAAGIHRTWPDAEIVLQPIADGGEGTCDLIGQRLGARRVVHEVSGPLGAPVEAHFFLRGEDAYLDASQTAGLWRLQADERDPTRTTTFGLGQQMALAMAQGARRLVIGLGGSATCDGGAGMAAALGFRFVTSDGEPLRAIPANFLALARIFPVEYDFPKIIAACDVTNPLLGPNGAAHVFAPQKGATPAMVDFLELALKHLADQVTEDLTVDFRESQGAGAAGGLGFGLMSFCGAEIRSGFAVVSEVTRLESLVRECDYVFTGEGSLDAQTLSGKGPAGIARMAQSLGKPVIAFGGHCSPELQTSGLFSAVYTINPDALPLAESMRRGPELLAAAVAQFCASSRWNA